MGDRNLEEGQVLSWYLLIHEFRHVKFMLTICKYKTNFKYGLLFRMQEITSYTTFLPYEDTQEKINSRETVP